MTCYNMDVSSETSEPYQKSDLREGVNLTRWIALLVYNWVKWRRREDVGWRAVAR